VNFGPEEEKLFDEALSEKQEWAMLDFYYKTTRHC
jgi:hypothetical protein